MVTLKLLIQHLLTRQIYIYIHICLFSFCCWLLHVVVCHRTHVLLSVRLTTCDLKPAVACVTLATYLRILCLLAPVMLKVDVIACLLAHRPKQDSLATCTKTISGHQLLGAFISKVSTAMQSPYLRRQKRMDVRGFEQLFASGALCSHPPVCGFCVCIRSSYCNTTCSNNSRRATFCSFLSPSYRWLVTLCDSSFCCF